MTLKKKMIVVTDDDSNIRASLERIIRKNFENIEIKQFGGTLELKKFILDNPEDLDILILDIHFGIGETGLDILPYIKQTAPAVQIILLTAMERVYGQSVSNLAGDAIFDFISKPVTETELIVKIKKALGAVDSLSDKIKNLQSQNVILSSILEHEKQTGTGAGRMFESEIFDKISKMTNSIMQTPPPRQNVIVNGQEIDIIAFTKPPVPFAVLLFETKYFPNAKLTGSINESIRIIAGHTETLSEKRRNLFEQSDNQFKQVSKKIEKILRENDFTDKNEKLRPFIQTFVVFTDSTDFSELDASNANKYVKLLKASDLTNDFIIKSVFSLPKRNVPENVKKLILDNLTK